MLADALKLFRDYRLF